MSKERILIILFLTISTLAIGQDNKFPPRDDSAKDPELQQFVKELKEIIKNRDSKRLLKIIHPQIKFDFDEGIGIEKFKENWKPEDKNSDFWSVTSRIVRLGGVFVKNRSNPFFNFVFPYVNQLDLDDADQYFTTLVTTGKDVTVYENTDFNSKIVGQLNYDIVNYDYEKSKDENWYYIQTIDKKVSGYIKADFAYSPVDYRMFLTKETGKWMISCIVAGD